jgi:hypothetical protein
MARIKLHRLMCSLIPFDIESVGPEEPDGPVDFLLCKENHVTSTQLEPFLLYFSLGRVLTLPE